jgi:thiamine-phosphate pyrophosphorylase
VIAIGGITATRVPDLTAVGAHGVAIVGAVCDAGDPAKATVELLEALGEPR